MFGMILLASVLSSSTNYVTVKTTKEGVEIRYTNPGCIKGHNPQATAMPPHETPFREPKGHL